jgi:hypothetical protein
MGSDLKEEVDPELIDPHLPADDWPKDQHWQLPTYHGRIAAVNH